MLVQTDPSILIPKISGRTPLVRELPADLETPVSIYLKLAGMGASFLLESVTGGEQVARYSFIGAQPHRAYVLRGARLECYTAQGQTELAVPEGRDILDLLRHALAPGGGHPVPGLPRFTGGLVGYLGYELASSFEPSIPTAPDDRGLPTAIFLEADTLVAFDHAFGRLVLIANPLEADGAQAQAAAEARLDDLQRRLESPLPHLPGTAAGVQATPVRSNTQAQAFHKAVLQAKEHIAAGDIFQVVLSQRFSRQTPAHPFQIYRELRRLNPSPYMFYFDFADLGGQEPLRLIGASPELHVRLEKDRAALRPIAGTRRRGASPDEDRRLEADLLADPKERAEHVMLVDLARNDLGRVCSYGSVRAPELMVVEHYSHVMHIVSQVEGRLRPEYDQFDLMRATFPAGTVSGAPKIRAMQIIHELEGEGRGPYAGAVGYFAYDGSMDTCITIRTLVMQGQTVSVQSGAGIVADSQPEREYEETLNKAQALLTAVDRAERSLDKGVD